MKYKYLLIFYGLYETSVYHYKTLREIQKDLYSIFGIKYSKLEKYENIEIVKIEKIYIERIK